VTPLLRAVLPRHYDMPLNFAAANRQRFETCVLSITSFWPSEKIIISSVKQGELGCFFVRLKWLTIPIVTLLFLSESHWGLAVLTALTTYVVVLPGTRIEHETRRSSHRKKLFRFFSHLRILESKCPFRQRRMSEAHCSAGFNLARM